MHMSIWKLLGLVPALLAWTPAVASEAVSGFSAACMESRDLYEIAGYETDNLQHLCGCLEQDFSANLDAAEIDLLRRDLLGQLLPGEVDPALNAYGGEAMQACLALEGLMQGQEAEPRQ